MAASLLAILTLLLTVKVAFSASGSLKTGRTVGQQGGVFRLFAHIAPRVADGCIALFALALVAWDHPELSWHWIVLLAPLDLLALGLGYATHSIGTPHRATPLATSDAEKPLPESAA